MTSNPFIGSSLDPQPKTVPQRLAAMAAKHAEEKGGDTAFVFLKGGERPEPPLTFGALDRQARQVARALSQWVEPADRVLLLFPQGTEFIAAFLGCLYAGVVAVPLPLPRPNRRHWSRLARVADHAAPAAILVENRGDAAKGLQTLSGLRELPILATRELGKASASFEPLARDADDIAFLQYTSGSTSQPKGVAVSHANLAGNLEILAEALGHRDRSPIVSWMPAFHDLGLIGNILFALHGASPCYLMSPAAFIQKPIRWLRAIGRFKAATSGGPNFAYAWCLERIRPDQCAGLDLSSWRLALNGAETVRPRTLDQFSRSFGPYGFRKSAFFPCYGLAEATLLTTGDSAKQRPRIFHFQAAALAEDRIEPAAAPEEASRGVRALAGLGPVRPPMDLAVVDPRTRRRCPPDRIGEIWLRGPCVARGYFRDQAATRAEFEAFLEGETKEPWLRTSDLGFVHEGSLVFTGRLKEVVVMDGINHYPQDLEETVQAAHPDLEPDHGACFAVEDEEGARLVVVQEVRRTRRRTLEPALIFAAIRSRLSELHGLAPYETLLVAPGTVPKTSSGKIQRLRCMRHYLESSIQVLARDGQPLPVPTQIRDGEAPPESGPDLAAAVARVLGINGEQLSRDLSFAVLGWDSKTSIAKSQLLAEHLGRDFSPSLFYDHPTPKRLLRYLRGQESPDLAALPGAVPVMSPAAIVGIGCRLPRGYDGPQALWQGLRCGDCLLQPEPPADRARLTPEVKGWGGWLHDIDRFDASFFGISAREAAAMDPQQRLLLEVVWECLENAGMTPSKLKASRTGVFVGISTAEYGRLAEGGPPNPYLGTGTAPSIAANRLSYLLDLRGPSMAVDTACSSSLTALHLACCSLDRGECDRAIVAGVSMILDDRLSESLQSAGMLASNGQIRSFDTGAAGYVRGEGCVAMLLKPAGAVVATDRIYARIRATAAGQDGRSHGLTAPHRAAQVALMRDALARAGLAPESVAFVEAHGSGTPLGDAIELAALNEVFATGNRSGPLWVGSCKPNFGHLEAAAGLAGVVKAALALYHLEIPPNIHFSEANRDFDWSASPLRVPEKPLSWPGGPNLGFAAVSSFGFGGSNAQAVLEAAETREPGSASPARTRMAVKLSAPRAEALDAMRQRLAEYLETSPDIELADLAFCSNLGRDDASHRFAAAVDSVDALRQVLSDETLKSWEVVSKAEGAAPGNLVFVFSDPPLRAGAGAELYRSEPVFRESIDSLATVLRADHGFDRQFPWQTRECSVPGHWHPPLRFLLACAYAELLAGWGIRPALVCGQGFGALAAACHAGILTPEEGLRLAVACGLALSGQAGTDFETLLADLPIRTPRIPILSPLGGEEVRRAMRRPEYWQSQMDSPDGMDEVLKSLAGRDCVAVVEVGPVSVLRSAIRNGLKHPGIYVGATAGDERSAGNEPSQNAIHHLIADLYTRGFEVDWAGYHRGHSGKVTDLPTYPFARNSHWPERAQARLETGEAHKDSRSLSGRVLTWTQTWQRTAYHGESAVWQFAPAIPAISRTAPFPERASAFETHRERLAALTDLALAHVGRTLQRMGWAPKPGSRFTPASVASELGISDFYVPWLAVMFAMGGARLGLSRDGDGWRRDTKTAPIRFADTELWAAAHRVQSPAFFQLVDRCGSRLAEVLRGETDPLEVLFPAEDDLVDRLYREWPESQGLHERLTDWLGAAMAAIPPGRTLRILEIGAGSGATADAVLKAVPGNRCRYWFTDISAKFLAAAQKRRPAASHVVYAPLDIERDPATQDIPTQSMDLAVAANVLHATRSPKQALVNLKRFLKPGGRVILIETLSPAPWLYLTFGLSRGWWRSQAGAERHPLLTAETWCSMLADAGFEDIACTCIHERETPGQQGMISASLPLEKRDKALCVLFAPNSQSANELRRILKELNPVVVTPGKAFRQTGPSRFCIHPHAARDMSRLQEALAERGRLRLLVHAWSSHLDPSTTSSLARRMDNLTQSALLLGALNPWSERTGARIWLLTRGAVAVPGESDGNPWQAALLAMAKCTAAEAPGRWTGFLDLGRQTGGESSLPLADLLRSRYFQGELALRGDRLFRPQQQTEPPPEHRDLPVIENGTYLITGGLGRLGRRVAQWLAEKGARHLALVTRGARSATQAGAAVQSLRDLGVTARVLLADLSRESEVRRLGKLLSAEGLPPLRGVIHAAGIPDRFHPIEALDPREFREICGAKIFGTLYLQRHLPKESLDFWVQFGSLAAAWGLPGQAAYAAANGFMAACPNPFDSPQTHYRTFDWGLWSHTSSPPIENRWREMGLEPLETSQALSVLDAHAADAGQPLGVAIIRDGTSLSRWVPRFRFPAMASAGFSGPATGRDHVSLPPQTGDGGRALRPWFLETVAELLGIEAGAIDRGRSLLELGFDSLLAVELKQKLAKQFGLDLPLDRFFGEEALDTLVSRLDTDPKPSEAREEVWREVSL